jgi:glyoxylase-like metal-dependent hydrolase (beta-lactamase superfamily II)
MYELHQVGEKTYYIECPAKIGIYKTGEHEVVLIDTGNDKEAAKKVLRVLEGEGWTLKAIYNTHSNADHIGGNQWIQKKTDCPVYTTVMEGYFTEHPELESAFLYGGFAQKALRNKFLMAKPSEVQPLTEEVLPEGMTMFSLPGHFFEMVGFRTPDGICFLGDCVFGENIIDKYHFTFIYDVAGYLETLQMIMTMNAKTFIPSHAEATDDIKPLAEKNIAKVREIEAFILKACAGGLNFEEILKRVFDHYALVLDLNQYVLVGSTVRSFLSYLVDQGLMNCRFDSNRLLWETIVP